MFCRVFDGDYTRNVDILNGLSHVNNYYLENRLTLSYTWRELTLGVPTYLKMYSRRGYGDSSMNRDDLVWNASIARSFPNPFGKRAGGTLVARIEGFDILGQLSSTSIFINGQGRTETISQTLPRYLMLHLTYQWNKIPKKGAGK